MDNLLSKLLSFPPHPPPPKPLPDQQFDEGIKSQIQSVKATSENKLLQSTASGESLLDVINPALNTVPYAFILLAHYLALSKGNKNISAENLWIKMADFLGNFDPRQIRYLGNEFTRIIEVVASYARRENQPAVAIAPIRDALLRLDPSGAMLTSSHILLAKLTQESRVYTGALQVFDRYILYFPGSSTQQKPQHLCDMTLLPTSYITVETNLTKKLKPVEVLDYFICTGMIYVGLRDWENALLCLENAITYPAKEGAVSKIMVEAYKKWILVSVLLDGKPRPLPKSTSSSASKQYHILAKPYEAVAQIFESGSASRLKAEVDAGAGIWTADYNYGLILHILAAYQQNQIKLLANVYSSISIGEVHHQTTSAETGVKLPSVKATELLVQSMIANGSLRATLSSSPNAASILTFTPGAIVISEAQAQKELIASTQRIQALAKEIKQTDRILTHEKDYIKYVHKNRKGAQADRVYDLGSSAAMDWNPAEDEDLMDAVF